jgi:hypothetical protein
MSVTSALAKALALTGEETLAIVSKKYPLGLVCTTCARVLATQAASYAKSNVSDQDRASYVCAECRQDEVERERLATQRAEQARQVLHTKRRPALTVDSPWSDQHVGWRAREATPTVWYTDKACDACGLLLTNRETHSTWCSRCLMAQADAVAYGKFSPERLRYLSSGKPRDYGCATKGRHHTLEAIAECPVPAPTLIDPVPPPAFCPHARPRESCVSCWSSDVGYGSKSPRKHESRPRSRRSRRAISGSPEARTQYSGVRRRKQPRLGFQPRPVRRLSPEVLAAARARMARINERRRQPAIVTEGTHA